MQLVEHAHHESDALQRVVMLSQVMETPVTLLQEPAGVQLRFEAEQVVTHIVSAATGLAVETVIASTTTRPVRIRTLLMSSLLGR